MDKTFLQKWTLQQCCVCMCAQLITWYFQIPAAVKRPSGSTIYIYYSQTGTFLIDFKSWPSSGYFSEIRQHDEWQVEKVKLLPYFRCHPVCDWRYKLSKLTGRLHRWFRCFHRNPLLLLNCKKNEMGCITMTFQQKSFSLFQTNQFDTAVCWGF